MTSYPNHTAVAQKLLDQQTEINRLRAAIGRVTAIHQPAECVNVGCAYKQWCIGCDPYGEDGCHQNPWPCPTIRATQDTTETT